MMKSASGTVARRPGMLGKPMAVLFASTNCGGVGFRRLEKVLTKPPLPSATASGFKRGQMLSGGLVLDITQLRKCTRKALTTWVCGTGLAGSTPVPKLLPGQFAPTVGSATPGRLVPKPPAPPPCDELAM